MRVLFLVVFLFCTFAGVASSTQAYEIQVVSPVLEMVDVDLRRMYPNLKRYEVREISSAQIIKSKIANKVARKAGAKSDPQFESSKVSRTIYISYGPTGYFEGIVFGMAHRLSTGTIQIFLATKGSRVGPLEVDSIFVQRSDSPNISILKDPDYLKQFKKFSTHKVPERAWIRPPLHVEREKLTKDVLEDHHAFVMAVRKTLLWLQELRTLIE